MEDKILVNLGTDHACECATDIIGREGEGNTTRLEITVPEGLLGCSVYLDFEKPNGEKLRTPKLEVENGVAYYDVVPYLLDDSGTIKAQVVLMTESGQTWKSSKKRFTILKSINAVDDIPNKEDFIFEAQKLIDALNQEIEEIARVIANDADFAVACNNEFQKIVNQEKEELQKWSDAIQFIWTEAVAEEATKLEQSATECKQSIESAKASVEQTVAEFDASTGKITQDIKNNAEDIAKNTEDIEGMFDGSMPVGVSETANTMKYTLKAQGSWLPAGTETTLQSNRIISKTNFIKPNTRYLIKADGELIDGFSNDTGTQIRFHHIATSYGDGDNMSSFQFIIHDAKILYKQGEGLYFTGIYATLKTTGTSDVSLGTLNSNITLTHIYEGETLTIS